MKQGQEVAYETSKEQSTYMVSASADYETHLFHLVTEAVFSLQGHLNSH